MWRRERSLAFSVALTTLMMAEPPVSFTVLRTTKWCIYPLFQRDRNLWFDSDQHSSRFL